MKNGVDVYIDSILNIPLYDKSTKECHMFSYKVRSFVSHFGNSLDSGHYIAGIVDDEGEECSVVICK